MTALLFENPFRLAAVLAVVNLVLLWSWRRRRPSRSRAALALVGLALSAALLALQAGVVTARERVQRLCHELAELVQQGDVSGVGRHFSADFSAAGLDRTAMLAAIDRTLRSDHPQDARLRGFIWTPAGPRSATVTFDVSCRVVGSDFVEQVTSRWRLTVRLEGDRWMVTSIEALPAPLSPIRSLRDVLR